MGSPSLGLSQPLPFVIHKPGALYNARMGLSSLAVATQSSQLQAFVPSKAQQSPHLYTIFTVFLSWPTSVSSLQNTLPVFFFSCYSQSMNLRTMQR